MQSIVQIAVRIIFTLSIVLMSATLIPLSWTFVVLPAVGIGAAMLSAFFFQLEGGNSNKSIEALPAQLRQIMERPIQFAAPMAADFPQNAPRGLFRTGMNCCVNAPMQIIHADPRALQSLLVQPPLELEAFIHYLAPYAPRPQLIAAFRDFFAAQVPPQPVPNAFARFLADYNPDGDAFRDEVINFRDVYNKILVLQPHLGNFLGAYEQTVQQNRAVVNANSQTIRLILSRIAHAINPSQAVQLDAAEVLTPILDILPNAQKAHIEEETRYRVDDDHQIAGIPDGIVRKDLYSWGFQLEMDQSNARPNLLRMFQAHLHERLNIPKQENWILQDNGKGGRERFQPLERRFNILEAPPALRIQVKRFASVPPTKSWLTRILPEWFPGMGWRSVKLQNPITAPAVFPIQPVNGPAQNYNLTAILVHEGSTPNSGHYKAYIRVDGQTYCCDDHRITRIDQQAWDRAVQQGYMYFYYPP